MGRAIKAGAIDFLIKPASEKGLLAPIIAASSATQF